MQHTTLALFLGTTPLLEKEWHPCMAALQEDRFHPGWLHRSGTRSTFPSNDHPMDTFQREGIEWTN
jgi:hypothetical protein